MSRYHSYLNSAKQILQLYRGEEPFASFLKKYFAANKKFGSKDRKHISNLCYCFFRLGKEVMNVSLEEKILTGLFLCSEQANEILEALKPEWNEKVTMGIKEKLAIVNLAYRQAGCQLSALPTGRQVVNIFPFKNELSKGIDHEKFSESFFIQPDLFLRLRPGKENIVKQKLQQAGIPFEILSESSLALPNASKIDNTIELDKEAVIQDYNSQRTGEYLKLAIADCQLPISLWDCCAGSGGKSIMAYDLNPNIELIVSDVRESILANLKNRFEKAGIKSYKSFIVDLASKFQTPIPKAFGTKLQTIICDAPCTGSGTWSRTPEQLYFFNEKKIEEYSSLQKKIVSNAIPHLQPGGAFVYITCSVFKKENEEVVEFIRQKFQLELIKREVLKGYDRRADSMFVAVFNS